MNRLLCFVSVGALAAGLHWRIAIFLVQYMGPLVANTLAFLCAFQLSYYGHKNLTYRSKTPHQRSMPRFFGVALLGFGLNQILLWLCLEYTPLSYPIALLLVLMLVAALSFMLSKYWAFAAGSHSAPASAPDLN